MIYHVLTDLTANISELELLQLTDDENAGAFVQTPTPNAAYARVVGAGQQAANLIDGYCRGRYTVPFSPVPDMIKDVSVDLTIYFCMMRKKEIALSPEQDRRYKNNISLLEHIQGGKIVLANDVKAPPPIKANVSVGDRVFTDEMLKRF
jgi:phage gp36-like protein